MIFLSGDETKEELIEKFDTLQKQYLKLNEKNIKLEEEIEHLKEIKELLERNYETAEEIINEKVFK